VVYHYFLLITVDLYTISPQLKHCFILVVDGERELKDFMDKSRAVLPYPPVNFVYLYNYSSPLCVFSALRFQSGCLLNYESTKDKSYEYTRKFTARF